MKEYYLSIIEERRQGAIATVLRAVLLGLSFIYAGVVIAVRWAYRKGLLHSYDLGRPVISVGNINWGGVGKTPLVEWLAQDLLSAKKNPVILTRGYMPRDRRCGDAVSDEAQLLDQAFGGKVPVIVNKDRIQGALSVPMGYAYNVFLLDDGFQHWRVKRNLDIVAIDTTNPFGNENVLPRGSLREPFSALQYADICVLTKADLGSDHIPSIRNKIKIYNPDALIAEGVHEPQGIRDLRSGEAYETSHLDGRSAVLVSGIGAPSGFEKIAGNLGVEVMYHLAHEDHYVYAKHDVENMLYRLEKTGASCLLTTEKDAVKLRLLLGDIPEDAAVFVLEIKMRIINGEKELRNAIRSICHH